MRIVVGRPPNYEEIVAKFPLASTRGVIFTYGDAIYAPSGGTVSPSLRAHEGAHAERQGRHKGGPDGWWRDYLEQQDFRFVEELVGHRAEYRQFCASEPDRERRAQMLHMVATRLASPLYGSLVTVREARGAILR